MASSLQIKGSKATTVDFSWNFAKPELLVRKGFGKELNKEFGKTLVKYSRQFVPLSDKNYNGKYHMADQVWVTSTKDHATIVYNKGYAAYQYRNKYNHTNSKRYKHSANPKATDHWLDAGYRHNRAAIVSHMNKYREELASRG